MKAKATVKARKDKVTGTAKRKAAPSAAVLTAAKKKAAAPAAVLTAATILQLEHAPYGWLVSSAAGLALWYGRDALDARFHRRSGGKRAARARRKYQGFATSRDLRRNLSAAAVRKDAKVSRPSLDGRADAAQCGIRLCDGGKPSRPLYSGWRNCVQVFGTTGAGKTAYLGSVILDAPGPVIAQSSRPDLRAHTVLPRSAMGPVYDLFPGREAGVRTNFGWSPLAGSPSLARAGIDDSCRDPDTAGYTAGYLMHAAPKDPDSKNSSWFDAQGQVLLRLMLHAAACRPRGSMLDVVAWVRNPRDPEPMDILADTRYYGTTPGWAHELASMLDRYGDSMESITATAALALAWMSSPDLKATACPELSGLPQFDPAQFVTEPGTLYICSEDRPHSSVTPFKACLMARIFDTGRRLAASSPSMRLDPPLPFVLDEAWKSGLPLEDWMPVAGGYGMPLVTGWQSRAQLAQKYGEAGGRAFWDAAPAKMIFGGYDDAQALKDFSDACGPRDTWHHTHNGDGSKGRQHAEEPLMPPGRLSNLAEAQVVLLYRRTRTVLGITPRVWDHPRYQGPPRPGWQPPSLHPSVPANERAIEAPRREAIPMPGAAPAVTDSAPSAIEENTWQSRTPQQATHR
jgi:hypothetical protein